MLKLGYFKHASPHFRACLSSANDFSRMARGAEGKGGENCIRLWSLVVPRGPHLGWGGGG